MKKDILNRDDIEQLVNVFYQKVKTDPVIGSFFTDVVKVNWNRHLPNMYDFWENVLFHSGSYEGNPMMRHQEVHALHRIERVHFDHWVELFTNTVDELFKGRQAEAIKQRATNIAMVMNLHLNPEG